ncbi:site-specific integrase [Photobacterium sp. TLY01]|uniref:tyrosine-type recombinase/integrase n=1 Tax=Photobacterium sp. TLY01 TaxID=2907534 RepID=UPI001F1EF6F6|nr:site-specific integrase [Photobacterium sp. TLY01]UIP28853.1 site-specific integrase [Photobacterium sp. TLY01]
MNLVHSMALSALTLKNLHGKEYSGKPELADEGGLSIRVSPKGKISFQVRYRLSGKPVRQKIGDYPAMSLREARNERDSVMQLVKENRDPRREAGSKKPETLGQLIDYWYINYCVPNRDKPDNILHRITTMIPSHWMKGNVNGFSIDDWRELFKDMADTNSEKGNGSGYAFNSIIELRSIARYGVRQGLMQNIHFETLRPGDFAKDYMPVERYLTPLEIGKIWRNIETLSMQIRNQAILRCLIVFGCRVGEIALAEKKEFDLENLIWTVPKEHVKGKKRGVVRPIPEGLVPYLEQLLNETEGNLVCPSRVNPLKPASVSSLSKIAVRTAHDLGLDEFDNHDWRRTLSTHWTDLGAPIYLSEKMLGHHLQGVMAVYNRSEMLEERRKWVNIWFEAIEGWARLY